MTIAPYLKNIGRGKDGARALDQPQACDLMSRVLDGEVSDLEVGAFAMAMRIKGEYVVAQKLGGAMFWELSNDDGTLLDALRAGLGSPAK